MDWRYVPTWRRRPRRIRRVPKPIIGALSACAGLLLFVPTAAHGLAEPISFQIARREWHALALMGLLFLIAVLVGSRLFASGHWGGGAILAVDVVCLAYISKSDPKSDNHIFTYLASAAITIVWLHWVARDLEDSILEWLAYGAIGGVFVSFAMMGIGERILLACLLGGINLLYYGYFRGD